MDSNHTEDQEAERARRRDRVNRMKLGIILFLFAGIMISIIAILILVIVTVNLSIRLNRIEKWRESETETETVSELLTETETETQSGDSEQAEDYRNVVTGIDFDDNMAKEGDPHKVYLTFDGSPGSNTGALLDKLAECGVKATFFATGTEDESLYPVYRRIVEDGHTLGMRSYSNKYSRIYATQEAFEEDFNRIRNLLLDETGKKSACYRFPGGSGNEISNVNMVRLARFLNQEKVSYFDWNVSAGDAASDYTVEEVVSNVTDGVARYKTSVVLLHDAPNKSTTVEALGPLIEALRGMGAEILPIDENTQVIQYIHSDSIKD